MMYALLTFSFSIGIVAQINAFLIPTSSTQFQLKFQLQSQENANNANNANNNNNGVTTTIQEMKRAKAKAELQSLILGTVTDPVLACPLNPNSSLVIGPKKSLLSSYGGGRGGGLTGREVVLESMDRCHVYRGRTDGFYDLLNPVTDGDENGGDFGLQSVWNAARVFVPPPLRPMLNRGGGDDGDDYVPMRDLFTSPAVSFAYERGWRQGFAAAGFPGPDKEFEMVRDFFEDSVAMTEKSVVVDMSCATGLFTRRLATSDKYDRVIGCDYSESMLAEARRRINSIESEYDTQLDLVRLDVAKIPMRTSSVNALHAGAAMHCWPDVVAGLSEIYRVLIPGGKYFGSTFLSAYFRGLQSAEDLAGGTSNVSDLAKDSQAFQYFESVDVLKEMLVQAGFQEEKLTIDVLGSACVIIKAEK